MPYKLVVLFSVLAIIQLNAGQAKEQEVPKKVQSTAVKRIENSLVPLLASRSVEKSAELISSLSLEQQLALVESIINDETSPLTRDDKIELIFALGARYKKEAQKQRKVFDLLEQPTIKYDTPILFVAAHGIYDTLVPFILDWARNRSEQLLKTMVHDALTYAIDANHVTEFKKLYKNGVAVDKTTATELLWRVVDNNRKGAFIPILVRIGGDVNAVHSGNWTLLTRAVMYNNYQAVQELVKANARINEIIDPVIGSALQIAIDKKYADIEVLLRNRGARE